jgi:hypothetical protein
MPKSPKDCLAVEALLGLHRPPGAPRILVGPAGGRPVLCGVLDGLVAGVCHVQLPAM